MITTQPMIDCAETEQRLRAAIASALSEARQPRSAIPDPVPGETGSTAHVVFTRPGGGDPDPPASRSEAAIRARLEDSPGYLNGYDAETEADQRHAYKVGFADALREQASLLADLTVLRASLARVEQERDALQRDAEICIEHGAKEDHLRARDIRRLYEQLEAADARAVQLQQEKAETEKEIAEYAAVFESIDSALRGDTLSDFMLSFPLVRAASDLLNQRDDAVILRDRAEAANDILQRTVNDQARRFNELQSKLTTLAATWRDDECDCLNPDCEAVMATRKLCAAEIEALTALQPCLTERRYTRAEVLSLGVDDTELDALTASPTKGEE